MIQPSGEEVPHPAVCTVVTSGPHLHLSPAQQVMYIQYTQTSCMKDSFTGTTQLIIVYNFTIPDEVRC